jgi:hydrogenase maturation protein HypF
MTLAAQPGEAAPFEFAQSTQASDGSETVCRRRIRVRGVVQGVGFRPFVCRLARELALSGWVCNDADGVAIEVQGSTSALASFALRLRREAPRLSRIDAVETAVSAPRAQTGFVIGPSRTGIGRTGIAVDTAVCAACLEELFEPTSRRYRHPFVNCTQCGPRYTITRALPYDRLNTSMAGFTQCEACRAEFESPASRRFHAQPNACPECGPRLALHTADGIAAVCPDPVVDAIARIGRGEILAIKGLGGFHLACDARNADAVARLRKRKRREEKPFAVMVAGTASAAAFAQLDAGACALLESSARPIVLLPKAVGCDARLPGIAPGIEWVGIMLAYTPLHYLLFHEVAGRPRGTQWLHEPQPLALVMTSANAGGEPLVVGNDEAVAKLHGIADAFLLHDRDILVRCDDSVVQARPRGVATSAFFVRRARGFTPQAIKLPRDGPPVLATGGGLKNAVCVTRGDEAFLSQHVGDLDNAASCEAMEEVAAHLLRVLDVRPVAVAHDLHPEFHSSRFAAEFAQEHGIPVVAVQHHHAHVAAVLAEHGVTRPALGLALDGVGLGTDRTAWGGELLRLEAGRCERLGHLRALPLPGGDRAAREPWRMACAVLHLLGEGGEIASRYARRGGGTLAQMLVRNFHCPPTTSAGRWFDAAAGVLGVKDVLRFEGQAAMLLEGLAARHGTVAPWAHGFQIDPDGTLDLLPLLARLAEPIDPGYGAALFHATLALALTEWAAGAARREGIDNVALAGGCLMNQILSASLREGLAAIGLHSLEAEQAPPNDGGLALGQAWVAMQAITARTQRKGATNAKRREMGTVDHPVA